MSATKYQAAAIADEADRDDGLCAALKAKAAAFLARLNPQAAAIADEADRDDGLCAAQQPTPKPRHRAS